MSNKIQIVLTLSVLISMFNLSADNRIRNENIKHISRYMTVNPSATQAQRNPMKGVIPHINFRHNIKTVGQALQNILKDSGYKLTRFHPDKHVNSLLRLPLPHIHRNMGPLTLEEALNTLAGEPWQLAVDPISRLVTFTLPSHFDKSLALHRTNKHQEISNSQVQAVNKKYQQAMQKKKIIRKHHAKKRVVKNKKKHAKKVVRKPIKKTTTKGTQQLSWSEVPKEFWITN